MIGALTAKVNVIAPHRGEEPCIQGYHGSGSVFFSGCNLRCVFCQNHVGCDQISILDIETNFVDRILLTNARGLT